MNARAEGPPASPVDPNPPAGSDETWGIIEMDFGSDFGIDTKKVLAYLLGPLELIATVLYTLVGPVVESWAYWICASRQTRQIIFFVEPNWFHKLYCI